MPELAQYLLVFGLVFAVNLLPAFGPPTWALLVFSSLNFGLPAPPLVLGGALAAGCGRLLLANGARRYRTRLPRRRRESLAAAQAALTGNRKRTFGGLALFALSPVPSGQLFVAAGLMAVSLLPLTAAFFAGRLVSYSLYLGAASLATHSLGGIVVDSLTSPIGIALQLIMLLALVLLVRVDWATVIQRRNKQKRSSPAGISSNSSTAASR
jgi:membrane protein YqaA with SNARE-associated domain